MKSTSLTALAMTLCIAASTSALAQGRHDEKPHGIRKPPTETKQSRDTRTATGGRHDEGGTTHGAKQAKTRKDNAKAVDDKESK